MISDPGPSPRPVPACAAREQTTARALRRVVAFVGGLPGAVLVVAVSAGCGDAGEVIGLATPPAGVAGAGGAFPLGRPIFQPPTVIAELCVPDAKDQDPTLTGDLLEIFFFSERSGTPDLWTARRPSLEEPWSAPVPANELNSAEDEINPSISRDGLRIWFHSRREPMGVWFSERASRTSVWSTPVAVALAIEGQIIGPALTEDELRIAVSVLNAELAERDVYESVRASKDAAWGPLSVVPGLNGPQADSTPFLAGDGRVILMSSGRSGFGDLYWARRESFEEPVTPEALTELNDPGSLDTHPHLSPDGTRIYFGSGRSGGTDLYEARLASP